MRSKRGPETRRVRGLARSRPSGNSGTTQGQALHSDSLGGARALPARPLSSAPLPSASGSYPSDARAGTPRISDLGASLPLRNRLRNRGTCPRSHCCVGRDLGLTSLFPGPSRGSDPVKQTRQRRVWRRGVLATKPTGMHTEARGISDDPFRDQETRPGPATSPQWVFLPPRPLINHKARGRGCSFLSALFGALFQ